MFALMSDRGRRPDHAGFVLPRWLRKPARMLQRIDIERVEPPRFAATMATALLFSLAGTYGVVQGGHVDVVVQSVTSRVGFAVEKVEVTGNRQTSEIDVLQQIGLDGWTSMVGFDVRAARERIAELPWVESATVRKVYPSRIEVSIVEREPFAIWQQGSQLAVIEKNGDVIAPFNGGSLAALPLVIGMGADQAGPAFVDKVSGLPGLGGRVRAYIRVADRRWDLRLDNGVTIRLPEHGAEAALADVLRLDAEHDLFSRDIAALDLRLPDRLTVALSPEAAEAHETRIEERIALRKKGARI